MRRDSSLGTIAMLVGAFVLAGCVGVTISVIFGGHDARPRAVRVAAPRPAPAAPDTYAVAGLGSLREAPPVTPLPARRPRAPKRVHPAPVRRHAPPRHAAPAARRSPPAAAPARVIAVRRAPVPLPAPVQRVVAPAPAPAAITPHLVAVPQPRPAPAPKPRPAAAPLIFDDSG